MILKILIVLKHFEKLKFTITITINLILENIFWPAGVKIESFGNLNENGENIILLPLY